MTFQTRFVINFIRRLSPPQRTVALQDLLQAFPDSWLDEALAIARTEQLRRRR